MKKKIFVPFLALTFLAAFGMTAFVRAGEKNSCVSCHSKLPHDSFVGENFLKWQHSVHSKAGITCNRCHGGNPTKVNRQEAHLGVYNSSNPKSKVYYKNVPRTCGSCHRKEYEAFLTSIHYEQLESRGEGPTCVSCHGSKAATIIKPDQITDVCTRCHNPRKGIKPEIPTIAENALYLMGVARDYIAWVKDFYRLERSPEKRRKAKKYLNRAEKVFLKATSTWHTFHVEQVLDDLHEAIANSRKAKKILGGT